jgi:hypothetical protein
MRPHLSDDARTFGAVAGRAFADAGGVDLARRVETDPRLRRVEVGSLLERLGVADLDPVADPAAAEAAAAMCRAAGAVALPYPLVPAVLRSAGSPPLALHRRPDGDRGSGADESGAGGGVLVDHGDAFDEWRLATIDGDTVSGSPRGRRLESRLGPFVTEVTVDGGSTSTPVEIALHLTLTAFVVAGALRAAVDAATEHVVSRVQFDKPLSAFQAVQFQLADAHVVASGVDEMAQFALWRCHVEPARSISDALGARLAALDAARSVLRTAQQLHGAAGVCDEYDVSVIARHLQPALRIPFGAENTAELLADSIDRVGFAGLFEHGAPSR